jgi:hypothetical protein
LLESKHNKQESKIVTSHPNRYIRDALKHAEEQGWTIRKSGPRAQAWGVIYCGFGHRECWMAIYSTQGIPKGMRGTFNAP